MMVKFTLDHYAPGGESLDPEAVKTFVAENYPDEVLADQFRQQAAQKRAKEMAEAAQYAEDLRQKAAAVVARGHNAKLAEANKVAMTYQERAEAAEAKARARSAARRALEGPRPPLKLTAYRLTKDDVALTRAAHNPSPRLYDSTNVSTAESAASVNKTTRAVVRNGVMRGLASPLLRYNRQVARPDLSDCDLGHTANLLRDGVAN
jgi:hypothetical protein